MDSNESLDESLARARALVDEAQTLDERVKIAAAVTLCVAEASSDGDGIGPARCAEASNQGRPPGFSRSLSSPTEHSEASRSRLLYCITRGIRPTEMPRLPRFSCRLASESRFACIIGR